MPTNDLAQRHECADDWASGYKAGYAEGCKRQYGQHEAHAIGYAAGCAAQAQEVARLKAKLARIEELNWKGQYVKMVGLSNEDRDTIAALRQQLAEAREALTPELAALADKAHAWISDEDNYRAQDVFVEDLEGTSQIDMARLLSALRALGGAT